MKLVSHFTGVEPKGSVLLAHGFGEHPGRYGEFIAALNAASFDVWTFDFAGHGASAGENLGRADVGALITQHLEARRDFNFLARTKTKHLFGHSMGGMITLASSLLMPHHANSVAVTGPALRPLPHLPLPVLRAASQLAKLMPGLGTVKIDTALLSHDPDVAASYEDDPLVFQGKTPLVTGVSMALQGRFTIENAGLLAIPTLILHGSDDVLADVAGSEEFVAAAGGNAELRVIEGAYHELLNEVERAEIAADLIAWFDEHTPQLR